MFPEEVQKHPLFEATEAIRIDGQYGYTGEKHLEVASHLDIVEKAWQQAINLSEKHGWTEINEILKDQLAFYNHYKDDV